MNQKTMRDSFIEELSQRMRDDEKIVFLTADFGSPVIDLIKNEYPDRFINVGIAEQNLINIATGMSLEGFTVYAYAIAPFITMRCYEQIRVCLSILSQIKAINVNLIGVGAGFSYDISGPSHHCLEDLVIMRTFPNIEVISPCDHIMSGALVDYTLEKGGINYIRFDSKPLPAVYDKLFQGIRDGFCHLISGEKICIIGTGFMTAKALRISRLLKDNGIDAGVIDIFLLNGLDGEKLSNVISTYDIVISLEEGFIKKGGLDSLLLNIINDYKLNVDFTAMGIRDGYTFQPGSREYLHMLNGIGEKDILSKIKKRVASVSV